MHGLRRGRLAGESQSEVERWKRKRRKRPRPRVHPRRRRHIYAIKGASRPNRPILSSKPSLVDVKYNGKIDQKGAQMWMIGTDTARATAETLPQAEQKFAEALRIWQVIEDQVMVTHTLYYLAGTYQRLGKTQQAFFHSSNALQLVRTSADRREEAASFQGGRAPCEERQRAADEQAENAQDEDAALGIDRKGMNRGQHA